jgi:hypothetical protein
MDDQTGDSISVAILMEKRLEARFYGAYHQRMEQVSTAMP